MAEALSADSYVHEGIWINWRRGSVFGLTLTLNPQHASILSPALAILISLAGTQLWRLIQFGLHQIRAKSGPQPAVYHQTQVTLRNSPTDLDTLWKLIRIGFAWRQALPVFVLVLWTLLHFSLVLTFGLFSSVLLESNDEVLSRSPWCGDEKTNYIKAIYSPDLGNATLTRMKSEYNNVVNARFISAQQRVDICTNSSASCQSNEYRSNKLNWTSTYDADGCPFNSSICHPDAGMLTLDTGFLSSFSDLGLNAPAEDRISFRLLNKCAPLDNSKHSSTWQGMPTADGTRQIAYINYGRTTLNQDNVTYSLWQPPDDCEQRLTLNPYIMMSALGESGDSIEKNSSDWDPLPELRLPNADTSLIVLAYNDAFLEPVEDPWFTAQQSTNNYKAYCSSTNRTLYTRELPLTAMSCSLQWQICNAEKDKIQNNSCTPLLGRYQTFELLSGSKPGLQMTERQFATTYRVTQAGAKANFFYIVQALSQSGSVPLRARFLPKSVGYGYGAALPANQWQIEASYWMDILLSYMQQTEIDYSTGQFLASTSYINVSTPSAHGSNPYQDATYQVCQAQIINSRDYRNFNFFALLITSIACGVIIVTGLLIEDCAACCRKRRPSYTSPGGALKPDMWMANSDLHLLRTVDELKNGTNWTLSKNGIPRTHPSYQIAVKDLTAEGPDVEEGKGVISPAVRRHFSSRTGDVSTNSSNPQSRDKDSAFPSYLAGHSFAQFVNDHDHDGNSAGEYREQKGPRETVVEQQQYMNSSDALTFSNTIQSPENRGKRNSLSFANPWLWGNPLSSTKRTERSDVFFSQPERQELMTVSSSQHSQDHINQI